MARRSGRAPRVVVTATERARLAAAVEHGQCPTNFGRLSFSSILAILGLRLDETNFYLIRFESVQLIDSFRVSPILADTDRLRR
jgi:hypothetical protein